MSAPLDKALREKHSIRSLPVRKDDEVLIVRGTYKGREGKVTQVYRKKWVIHVERVHREKGNGQTIQIGINPSNVQITLIKMDKDRQSLIDRKAAGRKVAEKVEAVSCHSQHDHFPMELQADCVTLACSVNDSSFLL